MDAQVVMQQMFVLLVCMQIIIQIHLKDNIVVFVNLVLANIVPLIISVYSVLILV